MRILLVEDNEDNRDMLSRRLRRKGHQVHTAIDGAQGISMVSGLLPELILMDLDLPQIDGWEATRRIKDAPETAHIPVIALTSHAMGNDRERAKSAGCDDFASKPIDFPSLVEMIAKFEKT